MYIMYINIYIYIYLLIIILYIYMYIYIYIYKHAGSCMGDEPHTGLLVTSCGGTP